MAKNPFAYEGTLVYSDEELQTEHAERIFIEEPDNEHILDPEQLLSGDRPIGFFGRVIESKLAPAKKKTEEMDFEPKPFYPVVVEVISCPENMTEEEFASWKANAKVLSADGNPLTTVLIGRNTKQRNSKNGEWKERAKNYDPSIDITGNSFGQMINGRCFYFDRLNLTLGSFEIPDFLVPAGSVKFWENWPSYRKAQGLPEVSDAATHEVLVGPPALRAEVRKIFAAGTSVEAIAEKYGDEVENVKALVEAEEEKTKAAPTNGTASKVDATTMSAILQDWVTETISERLGEDEPEIILKDFSAKGKELGFTKKQSGELKTILHKGVRDSVEITEEVDFDLMTKLFGLLEVSISTKTGVKKAKTILGSLFDEHQEILEEGISAKA